MRIGIFFISLAIMVGMGFFLNWVFTVFVPLDPNAPINWFAGLIGIAVIVALIIAGIVFIAKFRKSL